MYVKKISYSLSLALSLSLFLPSFSVASTTSGSITSPESYAWNENTGWIDFGTSGGVVTVTDSALTGYAYSENIGWISLNCSNTSSCAGNPYAVANNSEGVLSGYSWSENVGWINFAPSTGGVTISSSGVFSGYAYSETVGWINFTTDHPVTTDWRPASSRTTTSSGGRSLLGSVGQVSLPKSDVVISITPLQTTIAPNLTTPFLKPSVPTTNTTISELSNPLSFLKNFILTKLTPVQKDILPPAVVYATPSTLPSYDVSNQTDIRVPQGQTITFAVKADHPVKAITGYLTVKKIDRQTALNDIKRSSNLAAVGSIENKLVLLSFNYTDSDHDGIYTATIDTPKVHGQYDILTVLDYTDKKLIPKELHMTAVIDPEGYIYEASGNKQTRIPDAKVTLLWKDLTDTYIIWPADQFKQTNPQMTDITGNYSFLVPEGNYKLTVTASDYYDYTGSGFEVTQGTGIHENIELTKRRWWRSMFKFLVKLIN